MSVQAERYCLPVITELLFKRSVRSSPTGPSYDGIRIVHRAGELARFFFLPLKPPSFDAILLCLEFMLLFMWLILSSFWFALNIHPLQF